MTDTFDPTRQVTVVCVHVDNNSEFLRLCAEYGIVIHRTLPDRWGYTGKPRINPGWKPDPFYPWSTLGKWTADITYDEKRYWVDSCIRDIPELDKFLLH